MAGFEMSDWLRDDVERDYVVERKGWAAERIARVMARLSPHSNELETIVVWLSMHGAFTSGRTIYFSRRLLERLPDDDAAAFVVAHEIAHHRLGHVPRLSDRWHVVGARIAIALLTKWVASERNERDADLLAIEMCIDAGYDPERCLAAFELLNQIALDYGDVDASLGTEDGSRRSHPALRKRIEDVRRHVVALHAGHRLDAELALRRQQRKRRAAWAAGGAAAGLLLLLARRRL